MILVWSILSHVFFWGFEETELNKHQQLLLCVSPCFRRINTTQEPFTFSWAAVGSVMIWPSVSMAQVTPQNRQLIGRPASIRAIQAAFRKPDRSWGTGKEENTFGTPFQCPTRRNEQPNIGERVFLFFLKDTEPSSCNTWRMRVREERGCRDRSRDASQVSRTHCSCDRSLTPGK